MNLIARTGKSNITFWTLRLIATVWLLHPAAYSQAPIHLSCQHGSAANQCILTQFSHIADTQLAAKMTDHWKTPTATEAEVTFNSETGSCANTDFTVVALTSSSPNVLVLGSSTLELNNSEKSATHVKCTFSLPGDVIWADVYYTEGETGPSAASKNPAPLPSRTKLRQLYYGLNQAGAVQGSFIYAPAINSTDDDTITADVQFQPYWRVNTFDGWVGTAVSYDYDSRPKQDPDALLAQLMYAWRSRKSYWADSKYLTIRPWQLNVSPVGVEYAPASVVSNVTFGSTTLKFPFVFNLFSQPSALTITPVFGTETGHTSHNNVTGAVASGFILRGVAGANAGLRITYAKLTKYLGNDPITVTGSYRARIPAEHEVFTDFGTSSTTTTQVLSSQTRHFAQTSVALPLTKYLGAKVSYQFGSLPPAFRNFNHVLSITVNVNTPGNYEQ